MAMVLVQAQHQMEEKGPDLGLVLVRELGLGLSREEEQPQAVAQGVEMVELLQVVEKEANTAKNYISISCYLFNTSIHKTGKEN